MRYTSPSGDTIDNPSLEFLEECVLHRGEEYWSIDAGDAALESEIDAVRVVLVLEYKATLGFCIYYMQKGIHFLSIGSDLFGEAVEKFVGGQPRFLPAAVFVSRDKAWQVVKDFHAGSKRSAAIKWIDRREVHWDYTTGKPL